MNTPKSIHTFHIPVMGLAYTIDSPIRVAQYGIASVISITDDDLIEKMAAFYSAKFKIPYFEITQKMQDYPAPAAKKIYVSCQKVSRAISSKPSSTRLSTRSTSATVPSVACNCGWMTGAAPPDSTTSGVLCVLCAR